MRSEALTSNQPPKATAKPTKFTPQKEICVSKLSRPKEVSAVNMYICHRKGRIARNCELALTVHWQIRTVPSQYIADDSTVERNWGV